MKVRFYIDTTRSTEAVRSLVNSFRHFGYTHGPQDVWGILFCQDEEGIYCESDHFLFKAPTAITEVGLTIRRVEIYEEFDPFDKDVKTPFSMPNGFYQHRGAEAIVDEFRKQFGGYRQESALRKRLCVVAPIIEAAVELFNLIRQGKIDPVTLWVDKPAGGPSN